MPRGKGVEPYAGVVGRAVNAALPETYVVTLKLDELSFERLAVMRRLHFPAARNQVPAHLTLVHRLDPAQIERLFGMRTDLLAEPAMALEFRPLKLTGQGVAIEVQSSGLQSLRSAVVSIAGGELTRQDQQAFRPHVTVQNKVPGAQAKATYAHLSESFVPWRGAGRALLIWRYLGGPWGLEYELPFAAHEP